MIRRGLYTLAIAVVFALPVAAANAQTNVDEQYRSYLLQIIELLQQQVLALQLDLELQTNNAVTPVRFVERDFSSFLITDTSDIVAQYEISNPTQAERISDRTHREYFTRFFDIVPDEYDDYFVDLLVFKEDGNEFDGFVETVPPYRADTWRIGINESIFEFSLNSDLVQELYVHEFAHILSYEGVPGRVEPSNQSCHEYFEEFGCPPENSYLIDFLNTFWGEGDLDELIEVDEGEFIWSERELLNMFVTDYAGTNPAEDFAESFTFFVLEDRSDEGGVIEDKLNYFYQFPTAVELRDKIRAEI